MTEAHRQVLQDANGAISAGNLFTAFQILSDLHRNDPGSVETWLLLGNVCSRLAKYDQASSAFEKALALKPGSLDALINLSVSRLQLGDIDNARRYAEKAVKKDKRSALAQNILGLCWRPTDPKRAITHFERSMKLQPELYDAHHNLADTLVMMKEYERALSVLKRNKNRFDHLPQPYISLGNVLESRNIIDDATIIYQEGLTRHPSSSSLACGLSRCLASCSRLNEADEILNRFRGMQPIPLDILQEYANIGILRRDYAATYTILHDRLASIPPAEIPKGLLTPYAIVCRNTGHSREAIDLLSSALGTTGAPSARSHIAYALADLYDREGCYDLAFEHADIANRHTMVSDTDYYLAVMQDMMSSLTSEALSSLPQASTQNERPVFIVGMPRSGTTLIEQILSSHKQVHGAGEITTLWMIANSIAGEMNLTHFTENLLSIDQEAIEGYSGRYLKHLEQLSPESTRVTDKLPHNFMLIGLINLLFPKAKIIHCRRHPYDTCLSIYFRNFNDNHRYTRNLTDLGRFYRAYMSLMEHWRTHSNIEIHTVDYERLVLQPEEDIRSLIDYIGLPWDDACLRHERSDRTVATPSHDQATRPIYDSSVYRWKHYREQLVPLNNILGPPEDHVI